MKKKPQGRGRPPKKPKDRRTAELRIRLTEAERSKLDRAANGNTSTWAREILLREADKEPHAKMHD